MDTKTTLGRTSVRLYAATNALFSATVTVSALWSHAPLVTTITWGVSTIVNMSIAMYTSTQVWGPVPVPAMTASRPMRQEPQPGAKDQQAYC